LQTKNFNKIRKFFIFLFTNTYLILPICDLRFNQKKFAVLKFLNPHISEICEFWIANCAQEFADLRCKDLKNICTPTFAKIATIVNHTGGKIAAKETLAVNLPPVVHHELRIFPQNFEKIQYGPNGILRGLGETDS
jgi:hypothetical protein